VQIEYNVSYIYHAMYAYFERDNVALPGLAKYFKDASVEERGHAEEFMDYQVPHPGSLCARPRSEVALKRESRRSHGECSPAFQNGRSDLPSLGMPHTKHVFGSLVFATVATHRSIRWAHAASSRAVELRDVEEATCAREWVKAGGLFSSRIVSSVSSRC